MPTNNAATGTAPLPRSRLLLLVSALLFCAWIGWLAYLAFTTTRPIVLSRPQFLAAQMVVLGRIAEKDGVPDAMVEADEIYWSRPDQKHPKEGEAISVVDLPQVQKKQGWDGPGVYILPLIKEGEEYRLAPVAATPGLIASNSAPRIYRYTPATRAQLQEIRPR